MPSSADARVTRHEQRALWVLLGYRLLLVSMLLAIFYGDFELKISGPSNRPLFVTTTFVYLGLIFAGGLAFFNRRFSATNQALAMFLADAIVISLLIHSGGGTTNGLGMLLASSIALTSLLVRGRMVLFLAAIATFAIFSVEIYNSGGPLDFDTKTYSRTGLLGSVYFAIALLAVSLSKRLGESESLAQQRARDLADLARLNEQIIQQMSTGVIVSSTEGTIRYFNQAAQHLLGIRNQSPETLQQTQQQLDRLRAGWLDGVESADSQILETDQRQLRASFRRSGADNTYLLIFLEDASEAMQQARQIKLASLGRLTGGIAHQIRNPLSSISHAGQLLAESEAIGEADRRLTEIIRDNAKRVNDIIESILQLSRRQEARREPLRLPQWLAHFSEDFGLCHGLERNPVKLSVEAEAESALVLADAMQLEQVLGNLCENALRHAGREADLQIRLHLSRVPPDRVVLQVDDNGKGLSASARERLFEPFFTTRSDGTGLGLYIAKELCEANGISLKALPAGQGASFQLTFRLGDTL